MTLQSLIEFRRYDKKKKKKTKRVNNSCPQYKRVNLVKRIII